MHPCTKSSETACEWSTFQLNSASLTSFYKQDSIAHLIVWWAFLPLTSLHIMKSYAAAGLLWMKYLRSMAVNAFPQFGPIWRHENCSNEAWVHLPALGTSGQRLKGTATWQKCNRTNALNSNTVVHYKSHILPLVVCLAVSGFYLASNRFAVGA